MNARARRRRKYKKENGARVGSYMHAAREQRAAVATAAACASSSEASEAPEVVLGAHLACT